MNAPNDDTAAKGLRGWWARPPRSGMRRGIAPAGAYWYITIAPSGPARA